MRPLAAMLTGVCVVLAAASAHVSGTGRSMDAAGDAASIMAASREALGGEKKLAAITSFVAKGRTRQIRGNNLVPIEFEILCQLPDKYVRKDEIPAQESDPTTSGFNGDALIQLPAPPAMPAIPGPSPAGAKTAGAPPAAPAGQAAPPNAATAAGMAAAMAARGPGGGTPSGAPIDPRKARVISLKQDFARLTLGMFAASFSSYPLTFTHVGQAEAPQGQADVIEAKGDGGFVMKLFIYADTHLPIMVSWHVPATMAVIAVPGQPAPANLQPGTIVVQAPAPPAPGASKEDLDKYQKDVQDLRRKALAGALVEHRLYFADYRDIGSGIRFPFRLRRSIGGDTTEETNFDGFETNKRIEARRFEPVK